MLAAIGFAGGGALSLLMFLCGVYMPADEDTTARKKPGWIVLLGVFVLGALFLGGMIFFQGNFIFAILLLCVCLVIMGNDYDLYLVNHIPVVLLGGLSVFLGYASWLSMLAGGILLPFYVWLLFLPGKSEIAPLDLLLCAFAGMFLGPALGFVVVSVALSIEGVRAFLSKTRYGAFAMTFCPCLMLGCLGLQYMISLDSGLLSYFPDLLWIDLQIGAVL